VASAFCKGCCLCMLVEQLISQHLNFKLIKPGGLVDQHNSWAQVANIFNVKLGMWSKFDYIYVN